MNWAWASSLEQIWRSPSFSMWLTMAAAGFFALLVLITLLRAEKSVANVTLTVITLLSIGVAAAATTGSFGPGREAASTDRPSSPPVTTASLPALACVDDLAGDTVMAACERVLFASADSTAAAVSYAASRLTRLTSYGDLATANRNVTPELESLRRAVERDRYGLMAYVLVVRDRCTPAACAAFRSVANSRQIASNMEDRAYEGFVVRYSGSWNVPPVAPAVTAAAPGALATLPPGMPTGRPTNAEFPSASSTPAVSIMMPEPAAPSGAARAAPAPASPPAARPAAAAAPAAAPPAKEAAAPPAPKKQAPPKAAKAPTQLAPPSSPPAPQAPAAEDE